MTRYEPRNGLESRRLDIALGGVASASSHSGEAAQAPRAPGAGAPDGPAPLRWTIEQDAALLAMHAGGMSAADMAREIDLPAEDIQQRLMWLLMPKPHARSA